MLTYSFHRKFHISLYEDMKSSFLISTRPFISLTSTALRTHIEERRIRTSK